MNTDSVTVPYHKSYTAIQMLIHSTGSWLHFTYFELNSPNKKALHKAAQAAHAVRAAQCTSCTVGLGEIGLKDLKFIIKTAPLGFGQEI